MAQIIEKTLAEYIERTMLEIGLAERSSEVQVQQYEVYPEDDGYDLPRNPYSSV